MSPNQREAESLVGQEFSDDDDFLVALDGIAERGAWNVLITQETGYFARLREERRARRLHVMAPRLEPTSAVGSGDVLLAAFLAASRDGRPVEEALSAAVAAGAASTLAVGAGVFDPREVGRMLGAVRVEELQPAVTQA